MLTLFDAGLRRAVVANARAQFDQAADNYRGSVLAAFQQVEDALAAGPTAAAGDDQQQAARAAAERALALAMNQYQNGAVDYLQVVTAQITALQAQRAALDLESRELQASVEPGARAGRRLSGQLAGHSTGAVASLPAVQSSALSRVHNGKRAQFTRCRWRCCLRLKGPGACAAHWPPSTPLPHTQHRQRQQ